MVDHNHSVVYTLTTITPGTPLIFLLIVSTFNFVIVICNYKYSKLFKCFPKCLKLDTEMTNLRAADKDGFYQYIKGDYQF